MPECELACGTCTPWHSSQACRARPCCCAPAAARPPAAPHRPRAPAAQPAEARTLPAAAARPAAAVAARSVAGGPNPGVADVRRAATASGAPAQRRRGRCVVEAAISKDPRTPRLAPLHCCCLPLHGKVCRGHFKQRCPWLPRLRVISIRAGLKGTLDFKSTCLCSRRRVVPRCASCWPTWRDLLSCTCDTPASKPCLPHGVRTAHRRGAPMLVSRLWIRNSALSGPGVQAPRCEPPAR